MAARRAPSASYVPQVALDACYAPIIRRGSLRSERPCPSTFPARRAAGDTNIDLWTDGSIYPVDPDSGKPPPFRTLKECLQFICHGELGLHGYTCRLELGPQGGPHRSVLEMRCRLLQEEVNEGRGEAAVSIERLDRCKDLENTCMELRAELQAIREEMDDKEKTYNMRVQHLESEVHICKRESERLQRSAGAMKDTPVGMRRRARLLRGIHELNPGTGGAKCRVKLIRRVLQPHLVQAINDRNWVERESQRLYGDKESQTRTAVALAKILSRHEGMALASHPAMGHVETKIANNVLKSIGKRVGADKILAACDQVGVSHRGYGAIYKAVRGPIAVLNKDIKASILPSPYHVKLLRQEMNANLPQFIGEYYHVEGRLELPTTSKKSKKSDNIRKDVVLTEKNSLFTDLEVVQQSMVIFYGITEIGMVPPLIWFVAHCLSVWCQQPH